MKKNCGRKDRATRIAIASIIVMDWISGYIHGLTAAVLGAIGLALVLTSVVSFCPIYNALDIDTTED
jgi:hypothetical protein